MARGVADPTDEEPRRGGRVRKQVERFEPVGGTKTKQKITEEDDEVDENSEDEGDAATRKQRGKKRKNDEQVQGEEESDLSSVGDGDDSESDAENVPRKAKAQKTKTQANGKSTAEGSRRKSGGRKSAAAADQGLTDDDGPVRRKAKKAPKKTAKKSNGKTTVGAGEDEERDDCPLFNALNSPEIALQPVIEEWVETYQSAAKDETSERASMYELISCIVRCCGVTADVEEDETLDVDGVADAVERIQDESLPTSAAVYPLIAKTKEGRTLRANLDIFIPHLIKTIGLTPLMYETDANTSHSAPIMTLLINWLHTMSDSPLRSMRHTCTRLSLKVCTALCDVAASISTDLSLQQRQRDGEAKKGAQGPTGKKRLADLEAKCEESQAKKDCLDDMLTKTLDTVFVHRVRDVAGPIRADCQRELGEWFKRYGDVFIGSRVMSYVLKGCNDPDSKVRLETVKAIPSLMHTEANTSRAQSHLLRLAPRIVDLAIHDTDVTVRVNALHLVGRLEKVGAFDDDTAQRAKVATLIYASEQKVRKAAASFFQSLCETRSAELKASGGKKGQKKKKTVDEEELDQRLKYKALAAILLQTARDVEPNTSLDQAKLVARAKVAVEALWDSVEEVQTWEDLAEYLLIDHDGGNGEGLLEEDEEGILLGIWVSAVKHDEVADDEQDEQTKALIGILPKMFSKYQADSDKLLTLLSVPDVMKLSVYQDLRKIKAYEALWDDVTKLFLNYTSPDVLSASTKVIKHLSSASALAAQNQAKLVDLEEAVFSSLREAINGEEVSSMTIEEDRLTTLEAILLRISLLSMSRGIVTAMEDEEGGQSSGWDIVCAFAERGALGYKEEAKLIEHAIQIVFLHVTWLYKLSMAEETSSDKVDALVEKRDRAKDIYHKLALTGRSNSADAVRKQAFIAYLNLHMLFAKKNGVAMPGSSIPPLEIEDEVQHRLEGVFASAAERYASDLAEDQDDEDADDVEPAEKAQQEMSFLKIASAFVAATRCRVLDVDHAKEPLAHYGRFGPAYDAVCKMLVDVLRDDGLFNGEATTVQHVCGTALQNSFVFFLDTSDEDPIGSIGLSKIISSAFTLHGSQFSILKQIHPTDVADLHSSAIDFIAKKIGSAVKAEKAGKSKSNKDRAQAKVAQTLTFFKALLNLLAPVTGRDAADLRTRLEEKIEESGARVGTSKMWEPYRTYEKRLLGLAGRDPTVKIVAQQKDGQGRHAVEDTENDDDEVERTPTASAAKKRFSGEANGTPTRGSARKRKHVEENEEELSPELPEGEDMAVEVDGLLEVDDQPVFDQDLELDLDLPAEEDLELDLDFDLPSTAEQPPVRERSASVEPGVKRRKTTRKL